MKKLLFATAISIVTFSAASSFAEAPKSEGSTIVSKIFKKGGICFLGKCGKDHEGEGQSAGNKSNDHSSEGDKGHKGEGQFNKGSEDMMKKFEEMTPEQQKAFIEEHEKAMNKKVDATKEIKKIAE
ncbi:MAG: hypothetical protein ACK5MJ_03995 [Alphaproteobacteria bacterium]